jgi:hypothetical protein
LLSLELSLESLLLLGSLSLQLLLAECFLFFVVGEHSVDLLSVSMSLIVSLNEYI